MKRCAVILLLAAGCGSEEPPRKQTPPPTPVVDPIIVVADAAPLPLPTFDPQQAETPGRAIEVVLESTPPAAHVAVDGLSLGSTPVIWRGQSDGRAHNFSFELKDHENVHYRFIPIQNGVVHGTLPPRTTKANLAPPR